MAISLSTEAGLAGQHPSTRFNQRERKLLETVEDYVSGLSAVAATHRVVAGGTHTTLADASSPHTNSITVAGVLATDLVLVTMKTAGASPVSILAATAASGSITVRFSADPSTDHQLQYLVFRAI
jgi:hypothetical protein